MKNPALWSKADLDQHLQHALNLELWTIPLYLTALYSIRDLKTLKPAEYPDAAKLILSVVAQEMLHLELVCNISNALGYQPRFPMPVYDEHKGIPFIHPPVACMPQILKPYAVKPQALNKESLRLFCAIELPHPRTEMIWETERTYGSIAELYEALKEGIQTLWDTYYVGFEYNKKQKNSFKEYHNRGGRNHGFSITVNSVESAMKAIEAIVEQGEGADSKQVHADFRPPVPEEGKEYDSGWFKGNLSHYQKFKMLLHHHHRLPAVYAEQNGEKNFSAILKMQEAFAGFLKELETNFNTPEPEMNDSFWNSMYALRDEMTAVWESGTCPVFGGIP